MLRSNRLTRVVLVLAVAVCAAGITSGEAGAGSPRPPRIVAKPDNVMVNTKISLVGTGFPTRKKLTIQECSSTNWIVPQHPCDSGNTISVATDAHGRFARKFKVELCPRSKPGGGPVTKETCYIGNPQPRGVDTISLVGAARITVTYP